MKCPLCEVDMIPGYLNCGEIVWSTQKHKISLNIGNDEKYALKLGRPMISPHYVDSDYCPKCKRIIIDSSKYDNNIIDE